MFQNMRANSPSKSIKKSDQKVQFSGLVEASTKDQKTDSGRSFEIFQRCTPNKGVTRKLPSASSLSNLPKENGESGIDYNNRSSVRGTGSLERQYSKSSNSNRTSPIHRRPGSFTKHKSGDSTSIDLKRTQSLDKRFLGKASSTLENDSRMKTSSDFSKDRSRDRKYSKLKHNHDRSLSYERNPQLKAKAGQLILTQNGVNKHTSYESSTNVNNREHLHHRSQTMSRSRSECPHKLAQMVSRSPKRNFNKENNEEFGKDQKDKTGRKQDQAAAERQMKNRFPTRTQNIDSLPPNGKTSKQ